MKGITATPGPTGPTGPKGTTGGKGPGGYHALSAAAAKSFVRDRTTLFFTFAFPLAFLVVFGLLFGKQTYDSHRMIDYLAPGVLCWAVANGALFGVAYTLAHWRNTEVLRLLRMTPTRVPTILGSRFLVALGVALVQVVFFTGVAVLPIFGLHVAGEAILVLPVVLFGVTAFFSLGLVVGTYTSSLEAVAAMGNFIMLPMIFTSGTFYPIDGSPQWLQLFSRLLPLRYMTDGVAGVLSGNRGPGSIVLPCAALAVFTAVCCVFATKLFRWSDDA
ncbi:ABC transporter permease [Embleya sp. AB8]|uniref:ABC transporter permease n=1 Tax=Embleya sp. AB8 TaxID=3156304 RepID=UPI003C73BD13